VGKLPTLKPREVVGLLQGLGFAEVRQKGSHKQFRHPDGRGTTVPFHAGRDISPTLWTAIGNRAFLTDSLLFLREVHHHPRRSRVCVTVRIRVW
jgi:predicted RNA binding protein YcfA (HicA-like mRNA interferase family)